MSDEIINKIYRIQIQGADDVVNRIKTTNDEIDKLKAAVRSANKEKLTNKDDIDKLSALNKTIAQSEAEIKKLTAERSVAKKELDLYVKSQQKALEQQLKEQNAVNALPGSYNALYAEYKRLNAELRSTPQDTEKFIAVRAEVGKLKNDVDAFNRQFTKDGTLVGEYTTGLLQALKGSGLEELIQHQATVIKSSLDKLDNEFGQLQKELLDLKTTGKGSFEEIERKIIDNRKESIAARAELEKMNVSMKGVGGIGQQVTEGLNKGFKSLTGNIAGLVFGLGALQGISSFLHTSVAEFEHAEQATARLDAALNNFGRGAELEGLSKNVEELAHKFKAIDNDDLTNATEKLVTYGKVSQEQIKQLLPIIIDFAQKQKISVQESTDIIIKGLEGSGKALKTYGVSLKAGATDAQNFAVITQELGRKVTGAQEAFEKTESGGIGKFKQEVKDTQEIIGSKLLPVLAETLALILPIITVIVAIPFGAWATGLAIVTIGYVSLNRELVISKLLTFLTTIEDYALATAKVAVAVATGIATVAVRLFNAVVNSSPLGRFLSVLTLVLAPLAAFASGIFSSSRIMGELNQEMEQARIHQEELGKITTKATETLNNQKFKIDQLVRATKDHNSSLEDRQKALRELIALDPKHLSGLTLTNIELQEGITLLDKYVEGLKAKALAEASKDKLTELERKRFDALLELDKLTKIRDQELEVALKRKGDDYMGADSKRITKANEDIEKVKDNIKSTEVLINDVTNLVKKNGGDFTFTETPELNKADVKNAADERTKRFEDEQKALKRRFDNNVKQEEDERDRVLDDLRKTELEKEQARIAFSENFLLLQQGFNEKEKALESKYAKDKLGILQQQLANKFITEKEYFDQVRSLDFVDLEVKRNDEILKANRDLVNERQKLTKEEYNTKLNDLDTALSKEVAKIAEAKEKALASASSDRKKEQINKQAEIDSLDAERNIAKLKLDILKQELADKLITEKEYFDAVKQLAEADANLQDKLLSQRQKAYVSTIKELIQRELDLSQAQKEILNQSADLFKAMIADQLDAERDRIDKEKTDSLTRLDLEKEDAISHAQSSDEKSSIDKQYAQKKRQIEKDAGEELKKIKKSEVYIALASELGNIAVQAAANPANAVTFGGAGIAQYAVLAAIAGARALLQIGQINRQQFGGGGSLPLRGGRFRGPSHAQGGIKTSVGEFEGDELAVINKRSAQSKKIYSVSGTPQQIASAINTVGGGLNFAPGAILNKYEGLGSGSSLQAPAFGSSGGRNEYESKVLEAIVATNNRIDTLQVIQVTGTVTDAQKKIAKQESISSI